MGRSRKHGKAAHHERASGARDMRSTVTGDSGSDEEGYSGPGRIQARLCMWEFGQNDPKRYIIIITSR